MKVILFGATGMIGQGALRECLLDDGIEQVLSVGRKATGERHGKLRELIHADFEDFSAVAGELAGYDACLFCLGVSAAGMSEEEYTRITYRVPLAVAELLSRLSPAMTFVFVSGAGTDSSESGRSMWARVKGKAENALLRLPFKAAYLCRPGLIQPLHGIKSRTRLYRVVYSSLGWLFPVLRAVAPNLVITTEQLGRAMIEAARNGADRPVLEMADLNALARRSAARG